MSEEIKEKIKAYYIANDIDKILNYITNLQQKVEQLENENFNIRENIHLERISLPPELTKDKDFMELYDIPSYKDLQQKVEQQEKEIDRLNNIIDTMLEFSFFKEECPLDFGFGDEKEEKAQDVFYEDDYCEENCNDIYKKCWLKYFEKLQKLKENNK